MEIEEKINDFRRPVWCLLGLGFDAINIQDTSALIRSAASEKRPLFFSTPNLNFVITALDDSFFRNTVIQCNLSLLDGMPLLWVARLLGTGIVDKVSGSDLFDALWRNPTDDDIKIKVFFFGGETGVGEVASRSIDATDSGLTCVGFLNPGFGSVEHLSTQSIIDQINAAGADFLIVSLGAQKGQSWIDHNLGRLDVPIVSHLGAVINFVAGTVKRAPMWMQASGLEWLWRIWQEPALWKRYSSDGLTFVRLFVTRVLPYACWRTLNKTKLVAELPIKWAIEQEAERTTINITGSCLHQNIEPLRSLFCEVSAGGRSIRLDLTNVAVVDGAFIGLCLVLLKHIKNGGGTLTLVGLNRDVLRIFRWNCVNYLLLV